MKNKCLSECRGMVSRDPRPKVTKIPQHLLRTNARHRDKFHRARPTGVRESVTVFTPFTILVPQGDSLEFGPSSPIWVVMYMHIHTNLYNAKIAERIWGAGTGWL